MLLRRSTDINAKELARVMRESFSSLLGAQPGLQALATSASTKFFEADG